MQIGDEITVTTQNEGDRRLRIAGVAVDYLVGGYIIYMDRSLAEKLFHIEGVDTFTIKAAPAARRRVQMALAALCKERGLLLHSYGDLIHMFELLVAGVVAGLWGILVLGFVVAAFGIANTLTMNMLEQTRELALLRVVAMTRRQVRKLVLGQAAVIAIVGLFMGAFGGLITAWIISFTMLPLLGYSAPLVFQPWLLAGSLLIGVALVLAAGSCRPSGPRGSIS